MRLLEDLMPPPTAFPRAQLLARAALALLVGVALLALQVVSWNFFGKIVAFVMLADGVLGLLVHAEGREPLDVVLTRWLPRVWRLTVAASLGLLVALWFEVKPFLPGLVMLLSAVVGGAYLSAYRRSTRPSRLIVLSWVVSVFLLDLVLRVGWNGQSDGEVLQPVRALGVTQLLLGGVMLRSTLRLPGGVSKSP